MFCADQQFSGSLHRFLALGLAVDANDAIELIGDVMQQLGSWHGKVQGDEVSGPFVIRPSVGQTSMIPALPLPLDQRVSLFWLSNTCKHWKRFSPRTKFVIFWVGFY